MLYLQQKSLKGKLRTESKGVQEKKRKQKRRGKEELDGAVHRARQPSHGVEFQPRIFPSIGCLPDRFFLLFWLDPLWMPSSLAWKMHLVSFASSLVDRHISVPIKAERLPTRTGQPASSTFLDGLRGLLANMIRGTR